MRRPRFSPLLGLAVLALGISPARADDPKGTLPTDKNGRALNLDFETGTLKDWKAEGQAFDGQPVEGDTVAARRPDMKSEHQGKYWVGSFEKGGDEPQGTLTSVPFTVTQPFASFLVAGGSNAETAVELVRVDNGQVIFRASGDVTENLKRVAVDLAPHKGKEIFIRLVDRRSDGWGHLNFDDFRFHTDRPAIANRAPSQPDVYANAGLSPQDAAKVMTVPPGFKVTLFAGEPDVVQPIAMAIDDRGRVWVAEAYSYPRRVPDNEAKDRILIFEDKDNDGDFDKRTVFAEKLNLVSGLEVGFGGVWVGAAPYLMFIPDKDGDDKPDGPPQILLDGWAMHDTHETLNTFTWGPDGWLYGCHGVFTHSRVGKPGTPDEKRTPINAGIWRYHPTKHLFEVFAHGTSNPWGLDFDEHGQAFLTSCVIPHLYHIIQGGRYERQAGQHFNPYTYDDIKTIADHRHYVGANPHAGNNRSDSAGGGHAHAGAMIYQGDGWPAEYRGSIFMNNIHGARLNRDILKPSGSGFVGSHAPDFLLANDTWSQIVNIQQGPDGSVYLLDWYDKNQCHRNETEMHDRTNGRIFTVSYGTPKRPLADLKSLDSAKLAEMITGANDWPTRHARRQLQEREANAQARQALEAVTFRPTKNVGGGGLGGRAGFVDDARALHALWALHAAGGLADAQIARGLSDADPYTRAWTIQLACEGKNPSAAALTKFAELAKSDSSPVVRLYLASALQRLPLEKRWGILDGLVAHAEDAKDQNLPFMYWYAAEPLATVDLSRAVQLACGSPIPQLKGWMIRRAGAIGTPDAIALLIEQIGKAEGAGDRTDLLRGLNEALQGRRQVPMPATWPAVYKKILAESSNEQRSQANLLGLTFGDPEARKALRNMLTDSQSSFGDRREAIAALRKVRDPELAGALVTLLDAPALRTDALRGLSAFDDASIPAAILKRYADYSPEERRDALNTLSARPAFAKELLGAVDAKKVARTDLSADLIRQLRNLKDPSVDTLIGKVWGTVRETSRDKASLIARTKAMLTRGYAQPADLNMGRAVFAKTCQQCHTLFAVGRKVGPEITGSNRADLDYLLSNVLDPSALIGKDYVAHTIATKDGRVLTGLIQKDDKDAITLVTANETLTLPKGDIDEQKPSEQSMMPDDLWANLSEHEIRSLVRYLASPNQVPILATKDNIKDFYNGQDLTGWVGDSKLWRVENGEIVGKTDGLKRNEFLRSEMMAGDFRLTFQVKLVKNEGNSGLQFRSEGLPDGEMRGPQADIGAGWWGKLYDENGRGLLWDKSGEAFVKLGEWNTYEVTAVGGKIRTKINGKPCVVLDDPRIAPRGVFAFQLHSGGPTEVRFKDLRLELDPKPE